MPAERLQLFKQNLRVMRLWRAFHSVQPGQPSSQPPAKGRWVQVADLKAWLKALMAQHRLQGPEWTGIDQMKEQQLQWCLAKPSTTVPAPAAAPPLPPAAPAQQHATPVDSPVEQQRPLCRSTKKRTAHPSIPSVH